MKSHARRLLGIGAVLTALTAACGDDAAPAPPVAVATVTAPTVTSPSVPAPTTTASTTTAGVESTTAAPTTTGPPEPARLDLDSAQVALVEVATADKPVALTVDPRTGQLFVAERVGRVRPLDPASGTLGAPIVDISDETEAKGEQGLLGAAFSPDGSRLYLSYTDSGGDTRLDEITAVDGARRTVFALDQPASNHNGGHIVFGPDDYLYLGLGDGGGGGDPFDTGQDPGSLLGTIIRIDPLGADPYAVPETNPFVEGGGRPEVYLFGVRNPWRFSFDTVTGDLWIGDVGQGQIEEIDLLPASSGAGLGANLGWSVVEGTRGFSGSPTSDLTPPVFEYGHEQGRCSVTGGEVYRGTEIAALGGAYIFGDYCSGEIWALDPGEDEPTMVGLGIEVDNPSSFGTDADNELYVLSDKGPIYRLVPA